MLQFCRIIVISFVSEIMHALIPIPIPASIYGIAILFLLLKTGAVRLEKIKDAGRFLIEIMPIMFVPAACGLMVSWDIIRPNLLIYTVMIVVSTVIVMVVSGAITQWIIRKGKGLTDRT